MSDVVSDRMMYDHLEQVAARQDEAAYLRCQVQLLTDEVERLRLTDAEREAVEKAIGRELDAEWYGGPEPGRVVALRGLLERLGGER
jgi:hypothetical protein